MAYSNDGEGLHRHVDPADGLVYLYAMSFLDAAPRWFACFDQPDLKAPVSLEVACPEGWTVAGSPAQCVTQLQGYLDAGLGHVALRLTSWDQAGQLKRFLTEVAPAFFPGARA